jgi:hypothetical protein
MNQYQSWTTKDFENLFWHDVHVHGIRLEAYDYENGTADFVLDIDYILEWHDIENKFQFTVCPANLRFHQVFGLKMMLDYAKPTAGMCPFSIHAINREELKFSTGDKSYQWRIPLNWPTGQIEFQSTGFTQTLSGTPRTTSSQWIEPKDRH